MKPELTNTRSISIEQQQVRPPVPAPRNFANRTVQANAEAQTSLNHTQSAEVKDKSLLERIAADIKSEDSLLKPTKRRVAARRQALPNTTPEAASTSKAGEVSAITKKPAVTTHAKSSLVQWVSKTYDWYSKEAETNKWFLSTEKLQDKAYDFYSGDKPIGVQPLSKKSQKEFVKTLQGLDKSHGKQLRVVGQSQDESGRARIHQKGVSKDQLQEFAFRFLPTGKERPEFEDAYARLTVNVKPEAAPKLAKALADIVANPDLADVVQQAKIMGPQELGTRTDAAVIYVNPGYEGAQKIASYLAEHGGLEASDFIDHIPAGMHRMQDDLAQVSGIAYAETWDTGDVTDSSHGFRRGRLVSDTVEDLFSEFGAKGIQPSATEIKEALDRVLDENGFELDNPALLYNPE